MGMRSTSKVIRSGTVDGKEGVIPAHSMRRLVGCPEVPTDRIRVGLATYRRPVEALHWHPIDAFGFVLSGHATVRDGGGNEHELAPGAAI